MAAQESAASRARSATGRAGTVTQSIARIALSQVGVGDTPAVQNFNGVDCDPYTTLVGPATPNSDGCGYDQTFRVENENEEWCSDFAKWAWEQAGVTADMNAINTGADSFYDWGLDQGETMPIDSVSPQVGDAVVFFPPGTITPVTDADHVGIVTAVNGDGTVNLVNGDSPGTLNSLPGADSYEEAAPATASQTPSLAADLAYYAVHGTLPAGVTALPTAAAPQFTCASPARAHRREPRPLKLHVICTPLKITSSEGRWCENRPIRSGVPAGLSGLSARE